MCFFPVACVLKIEEMSPISVKLTTGVQIVCSTVQLNLIVWKQVKQVKQSLFIT